MLHVVWSGLLLLFSIVASTVGAAAMIGLPIAAEVYAALFVLGAAAAASGAAARHGRKGAAYPSDAEAPSFVAAPNSALAEGRALTFAA